MADDKGFKVNENGKRDWERQEFAHQMPQIPYAPGQFEQIFGKKDKDVPQARHK